MIDLNNLPERAANSRTVDIKFVAEYRGCSTHEIRRSAPLVGSMVR
jgi:hypothetical protein